jgi:RNA polymerase sigma-70 factor (ECF subfamily)
MLPALMFMKGVEELKSIEDTARFSSMPVDELRIDLVRALESLSPQHREIILLRDLQDMTIGEIAKHLGITREATKSRLHRARAMVKEYLLPEEPK